MDWSEPVRIGELRDQSSSAVPCGSGIYIWRRSFRKDPEVIQDSDDLVAWIERIVAAPLYVGDSMVVKDDSDGGDRRTRSEFVRMSGLTVGSGKLSSEKIEILKKLSNSISWRRELYLSLVGATEKLGPVLYVGQAEDICGRVGDHVRGQTGFASRVGRLGIEFEDLVLQYAETPELEKQARELLEQILTHVLVAPLTIKAG